MNPSDWPVCDSVAILCALLGITDALVKSGVVSKAVVLAALEASERKFREVATEAELDSAEADSSVRLIQAISAAVQSGKGIESFVLESPFPQARKIRGLSQDP